ncbi:MAG: hypothetical protein DRJ03_30045, partial [Chloroflexi bacterium]
LYPQDCGRPETGIAAIPCFERQTGIIGGTSAGEYLPRYVQEMPDQDALWSMYEAGDPIVRLDPASLPDGAVVEVAEYGLTSARLLIRSPEPFRAIYRAFYFPGWRVAVNGQNRPIVVTAPHGLISFDVPAGEAAVQVWFGTTPLRLGSALLSVTTLLLVLWLGWHGRREAGFAPASELAAARWWQWLLLIALAGGLLWIKIALIDTGGTRVRQERFDGQTLHQVDMPLGVNFGDELTLLGYNLPRQSVPAGQSLSIELFWAARGHPSADYAFSVRLVDEQGLEWSPKGTRRPGGFHELPNTPSWQPGEYARDVHLLDVLPGTPPGRYALRVTAFERETMTGLDVLNDQGIAIGQSANVATLTVARPDPFPDPKDLDIAYRLDAPLGELTLLGLSPGRVQIAPGDPLHLTTFWRAERPPRGIYTVNAELIDSLGRPAAVMSFLPGAPQHATNRWQTGEVIRDQQTWVMPRDLPPGEYTIRFQARDGEGELHGPVWLRERKIEVLVPERQTDVPEMAHEIGANFGGRAMLLGYDLLPASPRPGQTLYLTLYWRAEQEMDRSYKVFAHLLDSTGRVRVQHDAAPANWTRPTTGWLAGEIITDPHSLILESDTPPGEYLLQVGLYDPETNIRLPLLNATGQAIDNRVVLGSISVEP